MIKIRSYIIIVLVLLLVCQQAIAESTPTQAYQEYQVKAAYLYNFLMFVDWPAGKMSMDNNEPIVIGIIGDGQFGNAFDPINGKQVNGREIIIKWFKGFRDLEKSDIAVMNKESKALRKCHLLFICNSEKGVIKEITNLVKGYNVLTVEDTGESLESGGVVIKLVMDGEKIHFEINRTVALQAELKIRSQLLRLAKKVEEEA
ncbi:MAG: YfiR family protein [Sedimentisphaerales bacterium]|nr:YfiR family protein [Sedimentisphaerales bacterium]